MGDIQAAREMGLTEAQSRSLSVQTFLGAQWGWVRGFALPSSKKGVPMDPGPPPTGTPEDAAFKQAAIESKEMQADADAAKNPERLKRVFKKEAEHY